MVCIRCGKKIAEGKSFCDECARDVSRPLPDSPYLNTHIALPAQRARPKKVEPTRKPERKPEQLIASLRRARRAIVVLALVCALLLGAVGTGLYFQFRDRFHPTNGGPVVDPSIGTHQSG